jgi:hypothetical protein
LRTREREEYLDIRGKMCKQDGELYFTVSFVIFSVQETYKISIRKLKGKDFFVEQSATGTEIDWAIECVDVCRVVKVEWRACVLFICNTNHGIPLQPGLE